MQENFFKKIHQKIEGEREGNNPFLWGKIMQRMEEWMTNLYWDDDNKKKQNKENKGKEEEW